MAKGKKTEAMDGSNGSQGNGAARPVESMTEIATRFAQRDDNGRTLREVFDYADSSVTLGNGQFPFVPAHYDRSVIDARRSELALALAIAQRGAANMSDDSLGALVAAAESKFEDGALRQSLLEEAVDRFLYKFATMPDALKPKNAAGRVYSFGTATSAETRMRLVDLILSKSADATVFDGFPRSGEYWQDVIGDEIAEYVTTRRVWINDGSTNKRVDDRDPIPAGWALGKIEVEKVEKTPGVPGRRATSKASILDLLNPAA